MSRINHIWILLVLAALLLRCAAPLGIPSSYLKNPRSLDTMTTGCWIIINQELANDSIFHNELSGELIACQNDTFYILTKNSLMIIPEKRIKTASLFLFKDQSRNYLLATGLGLIPNIAGFLIHSEPAFLALGIPFALVGIITMSVESSKNRLLYPETNKIDEFRKFSRFPQGIPHGLDLNKLTLKIYT